ncbi:hypothetical protein AB0P21_07035 [Kribbella sp. NPDC056861]|uniref:hypothetical protein n=1 Tax=Kribbella sp. NPDC056861 TaxID=3154857 RepID=UPI0034211220
MSDDLKFDAIAALPDDIRVSAVMELRRWLRERVKATEVVIPGMEAPLSAYEQMTAEADRRAQTGDPSAPLWAAAAESMRTRAHTTALEEQFDTTAPLPPAPPTKGAE